jgi:hypothetical protein
VTRLPNSASRHTVLKAGISPAAKLIGVLIFAAFWNGIVSIFLVDVIAGFRRGSPDWFEALFLTPFLAIGLGAIGAAFYFLLALFNPRPFVTASTPIVLGESLEVEWETAGKVDRIRSFRITIEGREEASYTRGTTTSTDKETFTVLEVARGLEAMRGMGAEGFRRGKGKIVFPAHTMHTFESANNKIVWTLRVQGEIKLWPDVSEEYELKVEPKAAGNPA